MSSVTSVYLQFPCMVDEVEEANRIHRINQLVMASMDDGSMQTLNQVDDQSGGHKHPQVVMLVAGMNYWSQGQIESFWGEMKKLDWEEKREYVVMLTCYEQEERPKVWTL